VTWAVRASFTGSTDASGQPETFSQLTASEIASVRTALTMFSDVANITFNQVSSGGTSNNATILFSNYASTTDGAGAYALYPGDASVGAGHGDVRINTNHVDTSSQPLGSYSFFAIMHEIGHAVGLSHPGDYNAGPGVNIEYATHAQFQQDSHQYTILSYFDEESTTSSYNSYPDTLMLYDILATQQLYGANMTVRTGNTIYGFGSNAGAVYDFAQNTDPVMSIWDAGGSGTINASGYAQPQRISLAAGSFSNIGGFTRNISIAFGAVIENATGGAGADTLLGNGVANVLNGKGGADFMRGYGGTTPTTSIMPATP
jgi:serralysin